MNNYRNTPNDELLETLSPDIKSGQITLAEDEPYFERLKHDFPIQGSFIFWNDVPGSILEQADSNDYFMSASSFFDRVIRLAGYQDLDQLLVIGDSSMEVALIMPVYLTRRHLNHILDVPQHTYVTTPDLSWCIYYSMLDYMAFGFNPSTPK